MRHSRCCYIPWPHSLPWGSFKAVCIEVAIDHIRFFRFRRHLYGKFVWAKQKRQKKQMWSIANFYMGNLIGQLMTIIGPMFCNVQVFFFCHGLRPTRPALENCTFWIRLKTPIFARNRSKRVPSAISSAVSCAVLKGGTCTISPSIRQTSKEGAKRPLAALLRKGVCDSHTPWSSKFASC